MTMTIKQTRWGLLALMLIVGPNVAAERDPKVDLITIGARFVQSYSRTEHKAGDADGQFIEDVIIPSVADVVGKGGASLTRDQRNAVIDFLLASESSASEAISDIAVALYLPQKAKLCTSVAKLSRSQRAIVLDRIKSGLMASGKPVPRTVCK